MSLSLVLHRFLEERCTDAQPDAVLLAALVRRPGPMVFGVCRRLLGNMPDAEDAFQAVFVVLLRKVAGIHRPDRLGGWLHNVARRCAREALLAKAQLAWGEYTLVATDRSTVLARKADQYFFVLSG